MLMIFIEEIKKERQKDKIKRRGKNIISVEEKLPSIAIACVWWHDMSREPSTANPVHLCFCSFNCKNSVMFCHYFQMLF